MLTNSLLGLIILSTQAETSRHLSCQITSALLFTSHKVLEVDGTPNIIYKAQLAVKSIRCGNSSSWNVTIAGLKQVRAQFTQLSYVTSKTKRSQETRLCCTVLQLSPEMFSMFRKVRSPRDAVAKMHRLHTQTDDKLTKNYPTGLGHTARQQ